MYEGIIKSTIIAGRTKPELSAEMTGSVYRQGENIEFDEIVKSADRLWARKGDEYLLLASGSRTFISYNSGSYTPYGSETKLHVDTNEVFNGFIPQETSVFRNETIQKLDQRLIDREGKTDKGKDQYIIWYSSQKELSTVDFSGLTQDELVIAYNEIYARHGKEFRTTWLQEWFKSMSWYEPSPTFNYNDEDSNLTALERLNSRRIKHEIENPSPSIIAGAVGDIYHPPTTDAGKSEYFIWYSSQQLLRVEDLDWIQEDRERGLQIVINEIYARHGRKFNDEFYNAWFSGKSWYKPSDAYDYTNEDANLNTIEVANIRFVKDYLSGEITPGDDSKGAVDYLDTYGIIDSFMGRYSGDDLGFNADTGSFERLRGLDWRNGQVFYNNNILIEDGRTSADVTINGIVYNVQVDEGNTFRFGGKVYDGIKITNTNSSESVILGPGGTIYQRDNDGKIYQSDQQRNPSTVSIVSRNSNEVLVEQTTSADGSKSTLTVIREMQDAEQERINREIESNAVERFYYDQWVNDYIATFETTRTNQRALKRTMRLFGMPRQFTKQVDPRPIDVSTEVGRMFLENIVLEAPVITIIPGTPRYMNGDQDKQKSTTLALIEGSSGNFDALRSLVGSSQGKYLRYYDFQPRYIDYMKYVNILCRTAAGFLELTDELDGVPLTQYDWRNYRWDGESYQRAVSNVYEGLGEIFKKAGYSAKNKMKKIVSMFDDGSVETSYVLQTDDEAATSAAKTADEVAQTQSATDGSVKKYDSSAALYADAANTFAANANSFMQMSPTTSDPEKTSLKSKVATAASNTAEAIKSTNVVQATTSVVSSVFSRKSKIAEASEELDIVEASRGMFSSTGGSKTTIDKDGNKVTIEYKPTDVIYETTTEDSEETESIIEKYLTMQNFVQFMIDPESGVQEGLQNSTGESQFKGMFDNVSQALKEVMFVSSSGGMDLSQMTDVIESGMDAAGGWLNQTFSSGGFSSMFSRLLTVGGNILRGENIIMPQIYQSSQYSKSYNVTIHLKAEDGSKLSYYFDVVVPLMHLLALAMPRQTTTNTYGSPFLVKCFVDGVFTCNLGMITGLEVNKNVSPESWTAEGLPNEIDVRLDITDLYSDLTMSPQNEPLMFLNNSSLIEYLSTTCGLSLVTPQFQKKAAMIVNTVGNSIMDVKENFKDFASINERLSGAIQQFLSLGGF